MVVQTKPPTSHALVASPNPEATLSPGTGQADAVQAEAVEPVTPDPAGSRGDVVQAASPTDVTPDETSQAPEGSQRAPVAPVTRAPLLAATPSPSPRLEANERVAAAPVSPVPVPPVNLSPGPEAIPIAPSEPDVAEIEAPADAPEIAPEQAEDGSSGPIGSILAVRSSPRPAARSTRRSAAASETTGDGPPPLLLSESPLTAYARDGSLGGWTGRRGTGGSGNAAVGNYAGRVLVHLNNTPPVGATARGSARVVFVINPDGTLASVDVVQSTGTFELDNAAKSQVRRAAPFPVPPGGTSRRLSFIYRSR